MTYILDETDRAIINGLQTGFPISERPYADAAARFGIDQEDLIGRLENLLDAGYLTRFGPLFKPEALGGEVTLAALSAPEDRFDEVAETVNAFDEVAHNYARDHALNMWFVVTAETPQAMEQVLNKIANASGLQVLSFPKEREYFLHLQLELAS